MVVLPAAPQLLSPSNRSSFQGEQKLAPAHPSLPAHTAMGKKSAARICWRESSPHTQEHFGTKRGTFLLQGHWGWRKGACTSMPLPWGFILYAALPWSSLQLGWIHTCFVLLLFALPWGGSTPHRGVSVPWTQPMLLAGEGWQRPPVLVTTEHPQSSSAPSHTLLIPHSLRARSYTDSTESQNH